MNEDTDNTTPDDEPDLEATFRKWDESHHGPDDELSLGEVLAEEALTQSPNRALQDARRGALIHLVLLCLLVPIIVLTLVWNRDDFAFFLKGDTDVSDMGDLRKRWMGGERPDKGGFTELQHNAFLRFENGLMTFEHQSEIKARPIYYFFEPMTKTLVITRRALPSDDPRAFRHTSMHISFVELQQGRWIFPGDLSAGFSGQGRLYAASRAPRRWSEVVEKFRTELQLGERIEGDFWVFIDEVRPGDGELWRNVVIMGLAALMALLLLAFWLKARRRVRTLEALAMAAQ